MAERYLLTFTAINRFFKNNEAQLERGENAYQSGNVINLIYDATIEPPLIEGKVAASMRKKVYNVSMILKDKFIHSMSCSCPRGQDICHHMAAFALHCRYNISSTDNTCQWNRPKMAKAQTEKIQDMYPLKTPYRACRRNLNEEEIQKFKEDVQGFQVGYSWLLRKEVSSMVTNILPSVEDILASTEFVESRDRGEFIRDSLMLNLATILEVEKLTKGQSKNENWLVARKLRLTASKFGPIIKAIQKGSYSNAFKRSLFDENNLEGIKAVQWGLVNEVLGTQFFEEKTGKKITPSGLWLDESGFLGASPDGLVDGEESIIEVKCPFKFRESPLNFNDTSYIIYFKDGDVFVNQRHKYYHQIQGQLYIAKKEICYLVIWTPNESEIFLIEKDEEWAGNINLLKDFYVNQFLDFYLSK